MELEYLALALHEQAEQIEQLAARIAQLEKAGSPDLLDLRFPTIINTKGNPMKDLLLPLADCERMAQTCLGLLRLENATLTGSCLFFGVVGATMLRKHYGLEAKAVIGSAAILLNNRNALAYMRDAQGRADAERFHCWIEAEGWFIDLTSFIYPEIGRANGLGPIPRRMLQKPLTQSTKAVAELTVEGDFYCLANPVLAEQILTNFMKSQAIRDLVEIGTAWYRRPPTVMQPILVSTQHGQQKSPVIAAETFDGCW